MHVILAHFNATKRPIPVVPRRSYGVKNYRMPLKIGPTCTHGPTLPAAQHTQRRIERQRMVFVTEGDTTPKRDTRTFWLPFNSYFVFRNKFWIRDNVTIVLLFPFPSARRIDDDRPMCGKRWPMTSVGIMQPKWVTNGWDPSV